MRAQAWRRGRRSLGRRRCRSLQRWRRWRPRCSRAADQRMRKTLRGAAWPSGALCKLLLPLRLAHLRSVKLVAGLHAVHPLVEFEALYSGSVSSHDFLDTAIRTILVICETGDVTGVQHATEKQSSAPHTRKRQPLLHS